MVDVTLLCVWAKCVEHLVHARHGQGAHVENLCLTALEQAGAVCVCKDTNFAGERTKIFRATTVDTDAFFNNALTNKLLGEATNSFFHGLFLASELAVCATQLCNSFCSCSIGCCVAVCLECDGDCCCQLGSCHALYLSEHFVGVVENWCVFELSNCTTSCDNAGNQLTLQ